MESPIDRIRAILDTALGDILTRMDTEGINASGKTAGGFVVQQTDTGARLLYSGSGAPLETLEWGREAGAVPYGFAEIIRQWARDKGITFATEQDEKRFAGAVAYGKIARVGYGRPSPSEYGSHHESIYTPAVEDARERLHKELPALCREWIKREMFGR